MQGYRLFKEKRLGDELNKIRERMFSAIDTYDGDHLINTNTDDLVAYFIQPATVRPLALKEGEITSDEQETRIDVSRMIGYAVDDRDRPLYVPGVHVSLYIPYEGESFLFNCQPSTFTLYPIQGEVKDGELILSVYRPQGQTQDVRNHFAGQLREINGFISSINAQVQSHNASLEQDARQRIESRKRRILENKNLVADLGYPLRRRPDAPDTYKLPAIRKKVTPKPPTPSKAPFAPEPSLDDATYEQILRILGNMVQVMEQSPDSFSTMKEEDLRSHFLVQLNGQFEGRASGETFRGSGSTDILVQAEDRSVFIAECKFWKGPSSLTNALEQLLDYATWRDAKAAVLVFSRNDNFTGVLEAVPQALEEFQLRAGAVGRISESAYRLKIRQRDDPARLILVTVLIFNVPANRSVSSRLAKGRRAKKSSG